MLFSPAFHAPLTTREWDEPWVRAGIARIADEALAAVGDDGLWPEHPDDVDADDAFGCRKGLYLGAAGVAWALGVLGRPHPVPGLHARYLAEPDWPGRVEASQLMGEAGILLVADDDPDRLERVILDNAGHESNELLWGAPGTMVAALTMHQRTGEPRWADAWRASADELLARWTTPPGLWTQDLYGGTSLYIGSGHGFAGNVRSLWLGREFLDADRVAELERRAIATTTALAFREDAFANWAPTVGPLAHRDRIRLQWCHGAPGMVTSLAALGLDDEAFGELLCAGGELTWHAGPLNSGVGLCHGTAGNGLAFLALYERTGSTLWLDRARRFAVHALEQVGAEHERHGVGRHSLWTGDLGVAVMAQQCIEARAGIPTFDWF